MTQAYPLAWPQGWPRTPDHQRDTGSRFGKMQHRTTEHGVWRSKGRLTPDAARRSLQSELERLKAKATVLSSNIPLRLDGEMRADAADRRVDDPGVAIYFTLKGKQMVMAQDAFQTVAANMRSLALAIDALRALERHGGGKMMERAFAGFSALPPPAGHTPKRPWWEVLGYSANPEDRALLSVDEVKARFHTLAKRRHPDAGGSDAEMAELNAARDEAIAEIEADS